MSDRDYQNKTIAQALKEIDDKTADRSEVLPLLKQIERNTGKSVASSAGVAGTSAQGNSSVEYELFG